MSRYDQRGVSADKNEVHAAIKNMDKGLYAKAFCKVLADMVGGDDDYCNIMHADTAGTKTSLAYLYWKETGDLSVWEGIVQDAIVMNLDDMACVGCTDNIVLSSTIGRNKHLIPGEVISRIIQSSKAFADFLGDHDCRVHLAGGETADVGDIVRTLDVGYTAFARMKKSDLIVNDVKAGNVIVGFASSGQATYEKEYNGGMGSNGLTSARHDILSSDYRSYSESYAPQTPIEYVYSGSKGLSEEIEVEGNKTTIGKLILSPTRTYLPFLHQYFSKYGKAHIDGLIHCTGGAQTKVLKFVEDVHIIKDNLLPVPPLFEMIQRISGTEWKEMYQVFNMGHRLEAYLPKTHAQNMIDTAKEFGIEAQIIGRVEASEGNKLTIKSPNFHFTY